MSNVDYSDKCYDHPINENQAPMLTFVAGA
jgi:hypothetical protein